VAKRLDTTFISSTGGQQRGEITHVPERIGKYVLKGELGRGAAGVVYRSHDPFVRRDVAIKLAPYTGDRAVAPEDSEQGQAFFAEARAAGMLQHPNIVALYDAGFEGNLFYLVMEFVPGTTLAPFCEPDGEALAIERVLEVGFACANALDYSHVRGILHRDIKPGNVMLTGGVPKIMDFSIAEIQAGAVADAAAGAAEAPRNLRGSPLYMSPEQVRMEPLTPASDLYSLGAVLYQLLTRQPPYRANDLQTLFGHIQRTPAPRVEDLRPEVPRDVCEVIRRLLQKDPADRFQSGKELAGELARLFDELRHQERQLTRRDNTDALRRLRFFDRFSEAEVEEVMAASTLANHAAGTLIAEEGEIDNAFYLIVLGSAIVQRGGRTLHRLGKGDCYGEAALLATQRNTCSVVADGPVLALKVSGMRLEQRSDGCRSRFYKTFLEAMIYRLSMASAKAAANRG
jgi:serine/threonine protein kinase